MSTFNFLCEEKRCVAGAFIPPKHIDTPEDEVYLQETLRTDDQLTTADSDMLRVIDRMARLKERELKKLADDNDSKK